MKNLTQLIQEQKKDFRVNDVLYFEDTEKILNWHTSSLIAIIRNEIDRKKMVLIGDVTEFIGEWELSQETIGYNTAINEDIQYWQNVLEEIEKNV